MKNKKNKKIRSPFFYVGDKYKLMPQLLKLFPSNINNYYEPFVGGGSSFLNVEASTYHLNDIDLQIINLHKELTRDTFENFLNRVYQIIDKYELSISLKGRIPSEELRTKYKKTYYAKYNKTAYIKLRDDYNAKSDKDYAMLYVLLIFGFNHMIRFNSTGQFNVPVGNVDFNQNVYDALEHYFNFKDSHKLRFYNLDYYEFIKKIEFEKNDFVYCDPPYLISHSEYNKLWNEEEEEKLYKLLDYLNDKGVVFGISNLLTHKGETNKLLENGCPNIMSMK